MTRAERRLWIGCVVAGLITLVIAPIFLAIPGIHGCVPAPPHGTLVSFELVRSPQAVEALFAEACRASMIEAMRQSLWLDGLAFIPAYSAFFILFLLALRPRGAALAWAGIAAIAAGALCDQYEGLMLHAILADFPGDPDIFARLVPAVRAKFLTLAIGTIIAGWLLARRGGLDRALGVAAALGGLAGFAFIAGDHFVGVSLLGMIVAWPLLLAAAARRVLAGRRGG